MKKILVLSVITLVLTCFILRQEIAADEYGRNFGIGITVEPGNIGYPAYVGLKFKVWLAGVAGIEVAGLPISDASWMSTKAFLKIRSTKYNRSYLGIGTPVSPGSSTAVQSYNVFVGFENFYVDIPAVANSYELGLYRIGDDIGTSFAVAVNLYF